MDAEHAALARATAPPAGTLAPLPEDLLDADSVGLLYDETVGLHFLRDLGHLDALLATPALARDRAYASRLRSYLHDDCIPRSSCAAWRPVTPTPSTRSSAPCCANPPSPGTTTAMPCCAATSPSTTPVRPNPPSW
ncbi:hypothetical protein ABH941_005519 [Streptacidiphilus sp. EB103A]